MKKLLTFAELREGERFTFVWETRNHIPPVAIKTGLRTYTMGEFAGRVGVGDNPVERVKETK